MNLSALARRVGFIAELVGLLISLSGATVAAVLGRLMLAAVLGAVVLGLFFRLSGRRQPHDRACAGVPLYELVSVLSKVPVARDGRFVISASEANAVRKVDATTYRICSQRTLTCAPATCQQLDALINQGAGLQALSARTTAPTAAGSSAARRCPAGRSTRG